MSNQSNNFTGIINRVFIIFLLFTFLVTTGSFFLRHTINVKLEKMSSQLSEASSQQDIGALLVELDLGENNFQKINYNNSTADLKIYQQRLDTIFRGLVKIIDRYQKGKYSALPESRRQIEKSLQQKFQLSRQVFALRKNFDSLLRVTSVENIHRRFNPNRVSQRPVNKADTVITTRKEANKTGLFHRLREALYATRSVKVMTVREKAGSRTNLTNEDAKKMLRQLSSEYGRMAESGQALVLANLNLLTELRQVIRQFQDIDHLAYEQSREATLKAYDSTTKDLNTFTGVALAAVLVFIVLLLIYIRRAGWAERRLRVASNRSIKLAGQKSEILAIMSHEIRNKLMAINGAVFTLKRTSLSPEQEQKVKVVNLASDLVLETVNNVLDASKLEQGYAETRKSGPFNPAEAIIDAVEAMRFMAENKNLQLKLEMDFDLDLNIVGDAFRLKQVLLNLISNAIKYTEKGFVQVSGGLAETDGRHRLDVEVRDTGNGIPKEMQAKLFTPYYQAGGNKPGTGLGLYLCRELILRQGGQITVESDPGVGTAVKFFIISDGPGGQIL
ncbi:MAG: HAMP domain-containing histidine kinase [Mucilaginibacter sp.]|nr:HAMP domain-containing histidine kinase [Mucilaginibacter sp.]